MGLFDIFKPKPKTFLEKAADFFKPKETMWDKTKKAAGSVASSALKGLKEAAVNLKENAHEMQYEKHKNSLIGGKSFPEWEAQWQSIGTLNSADLTPLNKYVGLYRAILDGEIVYIGRAIEYNNGGLRKRLSDYTRDSSSARKHSSGQKMYSHRDQLHMEVNITGDSEEGATTANKLEVLFIGKYKPRWNVKSR